MIDSQDTRYFAIFMDRVKPVLDKDTVSLEFDEGDKSVLKITDHNPLNIHISYSKKTSKKLRLLFSMPTTKPITLVKLDSGCPCIIFLMLSMLWELIVRLPSSATSSLFGCLSEGYFDGHHGDRLTSHNPLLPMVATPPSEQKVFRSTPSLQLTPI